ncbi:uncharacterized protein LOC116127089 [Pistacia vera]|uniref:uncharacterized protein LOC116127089 n=1 Tax=Pistacia vera TaxID=55513 RepID=UPI001262CEA8|nr:uncharacterized protein LOC116127089 [Pistacia vera]
MEKLTSLSHLFVTVFLSRFASFMVIPAITDVTMFALCPGQDECSLAIYLTGFQQAIIGLGTMVMMPVIGNLSDQYGRKAMLTLPMTVSIIPLAILAYSRTTSFFYAYYVIRTLTAMVGEISINCLALAYVADNIPEGQRASAFGILSGVGTGASFVCGTLATRFLSTTSTFRVATLFSMIAAVYMRVFLKESLRPDEDGLTQPIIKGGPDDNQNERADSPRKIWEFKNIPSVRDVTCLLKTSVTFSQAAVVSFFSSLADGGIQASLLYFLKAQFHFNKNQFADLMLILGVAGMVSQLLFMPFLAPIIGERKLLSIGLFAGCINMLVSSIAWATWVPYATTAFGVFAAFGAPSLRSIASKQVGPHEQGKAQGCISGISSLATIISPFIFSPLTALFLSDGAPFYYPGFSIMGIGLALMIAFIQSLMIRDAPSTSKSQNQYCIVAEA